MPNNDDALRAITKTNLVAKFASDVLHCDHAQAEVFLKACADRFEYDGVTLQFKGAAGLVPATDEQCTGFFEREYSFLLPPKSAQDNLNGLDADLIAKARGGNLTARGALFRTLMDGKKGPAAEADANKQLDAMLAAKPGADGDDKSKPDNNPFKRSGWNLTAQARLVKSDPALAERLAKAAGVHLGAVRPVM